MESMFCYLTRRPTQPPMGHAVPRPFDGMNPAQPAECAQQRAPALWSGALLSSGLDTASGRGALLRDHLGLTDDDVRLVGEVEWDDTGLADTCPLHGPVSRRRNLVVPLTCVGVPAVR